MEKLKKEVTEATEQPKKLSYDDLAGVCTQLQNQNRELYNKLNAMNMANVIQRLNFLFKVVELKDSFGESYEEFVDNCKIELVELITIPEENKEDSTNSSTEQIN